MQTTKTDSRPRVAVPSQRRASRTRMIVIAIGVLVAVLGSALYLASSDPSEQSVERQVPQMSREDITGDLVRRGVIPAQTLEPAETSRDEITQSLVEQGLIPAQTLEPAAKSRQELTRDLVRRGLIPAQSLSD